MDPTTPVYVISVAAELADMHPQTLRQYDRLGLVTPSRAAGRGRRYSQQNVATLREIQRLSQEGVSLEGIRRILELENHVSALQSRILELADELAESRNPIESRRIFAAGLGGDVVTLARGQRPRPRSQALVVWRPGASRSPN